MNGQEFDSVRTFFSCELGRLRYRLRRARTLRWGKLIPAWATSRSMRFRRIRTFARMRRNHSDSYHTSCAVQAQEIPARIWLTWDPFEAFTLEAKVVNVSNWPGGI